ncbi:VanZ family protein [Streptomyces sp. MN13]
MTYECSINPDILDAFSGVQGQLNVLLFAPYGLFATLAMRQPILAAFTGVLFTAAVETAQATVPLVSRLCDTDDLVTNTAGVLLGAAAGVFFGRHARKGRSVDSRSVRRLVFASTPLIAVLTIAWTVVIDPTRAIKPSEVPSASSTQTRALNAALQKAFNSSYHANDALYVENSDGTAVVTAPLDGGFAEISWPDREKFTAHFTPSYYNEGVHAYKIPNISRPVKSASEAKEVAEQYASRYAPWAMSDSQVNVRPIDEKAEIGWIVEWRRWESEVLMPMRLDIAIEPSGRIIDLIARKINDPALPDARITEAKAWRIFEKHLKIGGEEVRREEPIYLAERRGDRWRIHWRLAARDGDKIHSAVVDATDGTIHRVSEMEIPVGGETLQQTDGSQ